MPALLRSIDKGHHGVLGAVRGVEIVRDRSKNAAYADRAADADNGQDTQLLERFKALEAFNVQDQEMVIKLIDAMIVKQRVESAMQPVGKSAASKRGAHAAHRS